ncbi:hypothetical protein [Halomonas sp. LC1]|uniref:hypothetical protein n=1 Tax=Halomonas sp. LC1 TaxID=3043733 RepID=UPI002556C903|nr:hypothetical protein [Halomonas sp. LC1]MDK9688101.1 hypothetical protein [Halomonas sp. LC1]
MKVKIITLYSGEKEYKRSIESVDIQKTDFLVDKMFIENKENLEAHNLLYRAIMYESRDYNYFVKLDADMVLTKESSLAEIIGYAEDSCADVFSIPVHDFMTDSMIWGLNIYKSGVQWELNTDKTFTDQQRLCKDYVVKKLALKKEDSLVTHADGGDEYQAFVFGIHRATKILQKDVDLFKVGHSYAQVDIIKKVLSSYLESKNKARGVAIIGAYYLVSGIVDGSSLNRKSDYFESFELINYEKDIYDSVVFFSRSNFGIILKSVGFIKMIFGIFAYFKTRLNSIRKRF